MYLKFARAVLFFPVAFILSFGSAKAITINATQSLLIDASFTSLNPPGTNITVAIQTSAADPFDGAPGGDYSIKFFNASNVGFSFQTRSPAAGSTSDFFTFVISSPLNSILLEATAGVSFDVLAVSLSSPDFNALLGVPSFQAVAAPYNPTATPLPAALPLIATGLGVLGLFGWRRKRKAAALAA